MSKKHTEIRFEDAIFAELVGQDGYVAGRFFGRGRVWSGCFACKINLSEK